MAKMELGDHCKVVPGGDDGGIGMSTSGQKFVAVDVVVGASWPSVCCHQREGTTARCQRASDLVPSLVALPFYEALGGGAQWRIAGFQCSGAVGAEWERQHTRVNVCGLNRLGLRLMTSRPSECQHRVLAAS